MGKLEHYYQNYSLFISACILKNRNTHVLWRFQRKDLYIYCLRSVQFRVSTGKMQIKQISSFYFVIENILHSFMLPENTVSCFISCFTVFTWLCIVRENCVVLPLGLHE